MYNSEPEYESSEDNGNFLALSSPEFAANLLLDLFSSPKPHKYPFLISEKRSCGYPKIQYNKKG